MNAQAFDPTRSRWIPWIFVGGMALVVVVNGVLIFSAISTFTGVSVGQAYDRGRTYNHVIEEGRRQDALGWTTRVALEGDRLVVTARNRDGAPVTGRLEAHLLRPLDGERVELPELGGAGRFAFDLPELRAGQWELRALLVSPAGQRHDIRQRFTRP